MTNSPRPVAEALRESPAAALLARCEAAREIGRLLAPLARTTAPGIDLLVPGRCELRDGVLWIAVESAAEAAKLRQAAPRLLAVLSAHGTRVYEMKTRVQAGDTSYPGQGTGPASSLGQPFAPVTDRGVMAVERAARQLPASALQQALQRLAVTLRGRCGAPPPQAG
jgi:hypothetical protein